MEYSTIAVLIPAYKPDTRLIELVEALSRRAYGEIVVVDDGSGAEYAEIFRQTARAGARVLSYADNRGKGAALKMGLKEIAQTPGLSAITADADGQHTPEDIEKIARALLTEPETLVLGTRDKREMPLRSKVGNNLTCAVFGLLTGLWLKDTQTGLRGLPAAMLNDFAELDGDRYEYEMNVLLKARHSNVPVREVPIATIYIDKNAGSHFSGLRDGVKIYYLLLQKTFAFVGSSLLSGLVDLGAFALLHWLFPDLLFLTILISRGMSSLVNYLVNEKVVFKAGKTAKSFALFYGLVAFMLGMNYLLIRLFSDLGVPTVLAKICADTLLFFVSYNVQNKIIFKKG